MSNPLLVWGHEDGLLGAGKPNSLAHTAANNKWCLLLNKKKGQHKVVLCLPHVCCNTYVIYIHICLSLPLTLSPLSLTHTHIHTTHTHTNPPCAFNSSKETCIKTSVNIWSNNLWWQFHYISNGHTRICKWFWESFSMAKSFRRNTKQMLPAHCPCLTMASLLKVLHMLWYILIVISSPAYEDFLILFCLEVIKRGHKTIVSYPRKKFKHDYIREHHFMLVDLILSLTDKLLILLACIGEGDCWNEGVSFTTWRTQGRDTHDLSIINLRQSTFNPGSHFHKSTQFQMCVQAMFERCFLSFFPFP